MTGASPLRGEPGGTPRFGAVSLGRGRIALVEDLFPRFRAGEPLDELAHDYGVELGDVEAAIRIEAGSSKP